MNGKVGAGCGRSAQVPGLGCGLGGMQHPAEVIYPAEVI